MIPLNWLNLHRLASEINYEDFTEDETMNLSDYTYELLVSDKLDEEDIDMIYAITPMYVNIKITNEGFDSFNNADKVILNCSNNGKKHIGLKGLLQLMKYINDREGGKC